MAGRKRVVILGGGMAALAAAHELSSTAKLRADYDVTVYQSGWRLGGKCASTRGAHPADAASLRIEEHGLHVWFGFYYNAFRIIRDCYAQLADPALTILGMFRRCSSTPLMEQVNSGTAWSLWPLDFPEDGVGIEPGFAPGMPSITEAARRIFRFFSDHVASILDGFPKAGTPPGGLAWLKTALEGTALGAQITSIEAALALLFANSFAPSTPTVPTNSFFSSEELALIAKFVDNADSGNWLQVRLEILALPSSTLSDGLRRAWILADLALAVVRGLRNEALAIALNGFGALDDRDFRKWLVDNKAQQESVDSAPVRALYDLCFAYTDGDSTSFASADFAAGTALRCIVRITMGYKGAVCYTMNSGMGEAVVAPLYQTLVARGVHFEFFHRVDRVELDINARPRRIHLTRRAATIGGVPYQPLVLGYWTRQPDFAQLVNGAALRTVGELDDADDETWLGEVATPLDLRSAAGDTAEVILAISTAGLPRIASDLRQAFSLWGPMIDTTLTVATQSAQLWMNVDLAGLGYPVPAKPPAMVAAPEPMDVWADMKQVIASETWSVGQVPASVQYVCGPLAGDFAGPGAALDQVATNTSAWLDVMAKAVWLGTRTGGTGPFDPGLLIGTATKTLDKVRQQHLRANYRFSERYVLSVKGSITPRLWPDALAAKGLYLAGDWTRNGLNAGCVEAAVMSGLQAAYAIRGESPRNVPGSTDTL